MKANEARDLANKARLNGYDDIVAKIEHAAKAGEKRLCHYKPELTGEVIKKLREDGFNVDATHDRDGYIAIVSWGG